MQACLVSTYTPTTTQATPSQHRSHCPAVSPLKRGNLFAAGSPDGAAEQAGSPQSLPHGSSAASAGQQRPAAGCARTSGSQTGLPPGPQPGSDLAGLEALEASLGVTLQPSAAAPAPTGQPAVAGAAALAPTAQPAVAGAAVQAVAARLAPSAAAGTGPAAQAAEGGRQQAWAQSQDILAALADCSPDPLLDCEPELSGIPHVAGVGDLTALAGGAHSSQPSPLSTPHVVPAELPGPPTFSPAVPQRAQAELRVPSGVPLAMPVGLTGPVIAPPAASTQLDTQPEPADLAVPTPMRMGGNLSSLHMRALMNSQRKQQPQQPAATAQPPDSPSSAAAR